MRVLITGASGFIGSHLVQSVLVAGHDVVACVRNKKAMQNRYPNVTVIEVDFVTDHKISDWLPRLQDVDVVINAVGIIRETGKQTFAALHTQSAVALFHASKEAGVKRIIQISALGADETAFSQYHLSKKAADEVLMQLDIEWAVVMPSLVYGSGAKSMEFFKTLSALPVIPLLSDGSQRVQPIHINDLTRGILQLLDADSPLHLRIEMVGSKVLTMKEIYLKLRRWLGLDKNAKFLSVPYGLALFVAKWSGFMNNTPMTEETIEMLRKGNTGDVTDFVDYFGFKPISFDAALAATPAQSSDSWYAGLFFLKPILRLSIAFVWIFTGVISAFVFPEEASFSMLAKVGIEEFWAPMMLYGAAAIDVALGVALLVSYRIKLIGLLQISIILLYTIIITFSQPEQWFHPFGSISKNLPLVVSTLIMIVMERRR